MIYALLFLQQLIAASTHLVAKNITSELHPTTVVLLRGLFACTAFAFWWAIRRRTLPKIQRSDWKLIVLLGLLNIPMNQLLFVWGIKFTTAPNGALAYAMMPAFTVGILALYKRAVPGFKRLAGIAIAFVGATIVLLDKGASLSADHTLGNVMVLIASLTWALFTIVSRPMVAKYGAVFATAISFFVSFAFYVVLFVLLPIPMDVQPLISGPNQTDLWLQLVYLGVITSAVGYGLWYYALTHMEPARVSVFNNLQPILTTILALLIMGTQPTLYFLVGGVVVLVGVIITQRG